MYRYEGVRIGTRVSRRTSRTHGFRAAVGRYVDWSKVQSGLRGGDGVSYRGHG